MWAQYERAILERVRKSTINDYTAFPSERVGLPQNQRVLTLGGKEWIQNPFQTNMDPTHRRCGQVRPGVTFWNLKWAAQVRHRTRAFLCLFLNHSIAWVQSLHQGTDAHCARPKRSRPPGWAAGPAGPCPWNQRFGQKIIKDHVLFLEKHDVRVSIN